MPISVITTEEEEKLRKKSIYNAPNNLSEKNISPNRIKDFIASPVLGDNISLLAFLKRAIGEINLELSDIEAAFEDSDTVYIGATAPPSVGVYKFWYDTSDNIVEEESNEENEE